MSDCFRRAPGEAPRLFGHRGTRRGAPENTLLAFQRAIDQGAAGVELDVRLCRGGEVVVIHDADLSRVGGDPRRVAELGPGDLARADVGQGQGVPRLSEALELLLGAGLLVNVEVKADGEPIAELANAVANALAARSTVERERCVISSFSQRALAALAGRVSPSSLGFLFQRPEGELPACDGVHPHRALVTPDAVAGWQAAGLFVNVWTVNEAPEVARVAAAGVDAIITDDLPAARAALTNGSA